MIHCGNRPKSANIYYLQNGNVNKWQCFNAWKQKHFIASQGTAITHVSDGTSEASTDIVVLMLNEKPYILLILGSRGMLDRAITMLDNSTRKQRMLDT